MQKLQSKRSINVVRKLSRFILTEMEQSCFNLNLEEFMPRHNVNNTNNVISTRPGIKIGLRARFIATEIGFTARQEELAVCIYMYYWQICDV